MWDDEEFQDPNQAQGQFMDQGLNNEPTIDPYELEQVRQEVEMAYEEFQRLLSGKPRLYSNFR